MRLIFTIYCISWFTLLLLFIASKFKKNNPLDQEKWSFYAIVLTIAPLVVLLIPCILVKSKWNEHKRKKDAIAQEKMALAKREGKEIAIRNYNYAKLKRNIRLTYDYLNIGRMLHSLASEKKYSDMFLVLDRIRVDSNCKLSVSECQEVGIGDDSRVIVCDKYGEHTNIWDYLRVEVCPMGAWQVFLLHTLWRVLPHFWHGGYNARQYIFSKEDLMRIYFAEENIASLLRWAIDFDTDDLIAEITNYYNKYYVSCHYWDNRGGLYKEVIEITIDIDSGRCSNIISLQENVVWEYEPLTLKCHY